MQDLQFPVDAALPRKAVVVPEIRLMRTVEGRSAIGPSEVDTRPYSTEHTAGSTNTYDAMAVHILIEKQGNEDLEAKRATPAQTLAESILAPIVRAV